MYVITLTGQDGGYAELYQPGSLVGAGFFQDGQRWGECEQKTIRAEEAEG